MVGNTRKQVKARRRAITKLINSTTTKTRDGTVDSSVSMKCCCTKANAGMASTTALDIGTSLPREKNPFSVCMKTSSLEKVESTTATNRSGQCVVCGVASTSSCSACGKVFYCGKAHQKKHWNEGHKSVCYPCEEMSPDEQKGLVGPLGKGPFMKASKDIHPMEKIYEDQPLITGPGCCADLAYEPVCLGCTDPVLDSQTCSLCRWPLCGPECRKDTLHEEYECEIFAKNGVQQLKDPFQYELVRILRCLLTKKKNPDVYQQLLKLNGALDQRKTLDHLIEATNTACKFIRENCQLVEFDRDIINHMSGVVDLQTQPSGKHRSSMQIFSFPTKLLHACDANTRIIEVARPNGENLLQVVALRAIKRGEPLTHRLLISLEPTFERQRFLNEHYYFQCTCSLCKDPTEKGSYFSAVKCPSCSENSKGSCEAHQNLRFLLPMSPTNLSSDWACNFCSSEFSGEIMLESLDIFEHKYWKFKYRTLAGMEEDDKIIAIRKKIVEFEEELHPNNYFVWKLKQLLFNKLTERILLMLPPSSWKKFRDIYTEVEDLARCVMATVNALQPGLTLIRGRSLHDLVAAYWGYIQWAVLYGRANSFKSHHCASEFYNHVSTVSTIFEPELTDIRKVIDSVVFMRDHVNEVRLRMQRLGKVIKMEKHFYCSADLRRKK